tara:strand:+ start:409 stop:999 length:591 start_codon:yes stop_codon:yes gene_type:complete
MPTDARVDAYIAKQADFAQAILREIRARMHAACPDIGEDIKWSMPFFTLQGRPLANMAGFKAHASFGFWARDAMATGKEGEAMGQFGRLTDITDLPPEAEFAALVREAVAVALAGPAPRAPKAAKPEAEIPADLAEALARDEIAAATFHGFPPGARREYCDWIAEAKRPATREKRLADTIAWLREGKRRNWKYENC